MEPLLERIVGRRAFIRGTALAGVGLATFAVVGCDDEPVEERILEDRKFAEQYLASADFGDFRNVVVGGEQYALREAHSRRVHGTPLETLGVALLAAVYNNQATDVIVAHLAEPYLPVRPPERAADHIQAVTADETYHRLDPLPKFRGVGPFLSLPLPEVIRERSFVEGEAYFAWAAVPFGEWRRNGVTVGYAAFNVSVDFYQGDRLDGSSAPMADITDRLNPIFFENLDPAALNL